MATPDGGFYFYKLNLGRAFNVGYWKRAIISEMKKVEGITVYPGKQFVLMTLYYRAEFLIF